MILLIEQALNVLGRPGDSLTNHQMVNACIRLKKKSLMLLNI
jgi:hypothetical protein